MATAPVPRVTLADVAASAGVSRATASLVLRESPLVAATTRERVHDSMRRLGYVYHRGAASLRTRRSGAVGLIVTDIANPFFAELTAGVEERLDGARHVALLGNTAESAEKQERLIAAIHEHGADGLLLCPAEGTSVETIERLRAWRLPCVSLVRYLPGATGDYAGADNALGAELAVEHLIAHGHRRIAFVGGLPRSSARRDRLAGYARALRRHGLAPQDTSCVEVPNPGTLPVDTSNPGTLPVDMGDLDILCPHCAPTREGGYQAALALMRGPEPPSAVLCYNDVVAFGVLLGLRAAGLEPGRDVAVIGFDDVAEAALWRPALTTVAISPRRIGHEAAELLLQRMAQPDGPPRRAIVPPRLVVRESCGSHRA